jgi:xylulose-5-phosphate/fructose-6-phosphate phosphoketolase
MSRPSAETLEAIDRYWRAADYLSVGQIYLLDNPLLREPLAAEHVKPRLLGHFGTVPGLNLAYTYLNRAIRDAGVDGRGMAAPGSAGPARHLGPANTPCDGSVASEVQ